MIEILGLSESTVTSMKSILGDRIFRYEGNAVECDTITVALNQNAEIKFYNFDSSVTVQLGSKKYLLENEDYWRIDLE